MKLWEVTPRMDLLSDREDNEAYLAADEGEKYIIYFTHGGAVDLDLSSYEKPFILNWVSVNSGEWGSESALEKMPSCYFGSDWCHDAPSLSRGRRGWAIDE